MIERACMKYPLLCYIALMALITSCRDRKDAGADAQDEDSLHTTLPDTAVSAEAIHSFTTAGFTDYVKRLSPSFDWSKFTLTTSWQEDSLLTTPFTPDKNFYTNYGRFLKYSPDSSRFIDLDSYNIDISQDVEGHWVGSESGPDTEVSLVNPRSGKKMRLIFLGPGGTVEDAFWENNQEIVLLGVQDGEADAGKLLSVWKFHLPTKTWYLYQLADPSLAAQLAGQWRKERLKNVLIK